MARRTARRTRCDLVDPPPTRAAAMGLSLVRKRPAPALCPSASLVSRLPAMLGLLRHGGAEQAGRPERQDEDQDHERERVAVLRAHGKVGRTQSLDDAQQQSAQEGAGDFADPTPVSYTHLRA